MVKAAEKLFLLASFKLFITSNRILPPRFYLAFDLLVFVSFHCEKKHNCAFDQGQEDEAE